MAAGIWDSTFAAELVLTAEHTARLSA